MLMLQEDLHSPAFGYVPRRCLAYQQEQKNTKPETADCVAAGLIYSTHFRSLLSPPELPFTQSQRSTFLENDEGVG
jgi:hypothetical protein